jgi:phosphoglycolate phosphatase
VATGRSPVATVTPETCFGPSSAGFCYQEPPRDGMGYMVMSYRAAIFDLDGTLIDSVRDIAESMNRSLAAMGYPTHPVEQYNVFIGEGIKILVERALPECARDEASVLTFLDGYRRDYLESWNVFTTIYEGIPDVLRRLVGAGIPLGVLSNKPDEATRKCTEHFFPDIPFVAVYGQRDGVPRKPDPAIAWEIAAAMNQPPASCVFVGDTMTDMQTAVAAGMFPAGVSWGFRGEEELLAHGAKMIAHTPRDLLGLFGLGGDGAGDE